MKELICENLQEILNIFKPSSKQRTRGKAKWNKLGTKACKPIFQLVLMCQPTRRGDKSCLTCLKKERSLKPGTLFDVDIVEYKKRVRMFWKYYTWFRWCEDYCGHAYCVIYVSCIVLMFKGKLLFFAYRK